MDGVRAQGIYAKILDGEEEYLFQGDPAGRYVCLIEHVGITHRRADMKMGPRKSAPVLWMEVEEQDFLPTWGEQVVPVLARPYLPRSKPMILHDGVVLSRVQEDFTLTA